MNITLNNDGQSATIAPEGRIDTVTAPELEDCISKLPQGLAELKFDFAKVEYISSAGLRVLLVALKTMNKAGAPMSIANISRPVRDVFDMTGFSGIFTIV